MMNDMGLDNIYVYLQIYTYIYIHVIEMHAMPFLSFFVVSLKSTMGPFFQVSNSFLLYIYNLI